MTSLEAEFEGPEPGRAVHAWLETRLPFERLSESQLRIRSELRMRLARLEAREGEVLHASYAGRRHPGSDVENLLFYNVDMGGTCFGGCGKFGMRFEVASGPTRRASSGIDRPCAYAYRLAPRGSGFEHWTTSRELASFRDVPLLAGGGSLIARTWLSLLRADVDVVAAQSEPSAPFSVQLSARGHAKVSRPAVVKSLIDGTVSAFQAHGDAATLDRVATRVGKSLGAETPEVADLLAARDRAVLGVQAKLVWPRADGVQWNPGDDRCLAGELLSEGGSGEMILTGRIAEIESR